MKQITAVVDFFMNKDNMQYLLKGNEIDNLDEVHHNLFTNIKIKKVLYLFMNLDMMTLIIQIINLITLTKSITQNFQMILIE